MCGASGTVMDSCLVVYSQSASDVLIVLCGRLMIEHMTSARMGHRISYDAVTCTKSLSNYDEGVKRSVD